MKINLTGPNTVGCFNKIIFNARKVNRSLFKKTITRNILQIEKHIEENICNFTYNCLKDEGWIKALVEQNENKFYHALCSVLYAFLDGEEPQYNMFLSMNCNHMRLFGEKKTDVIRELDWHKFNENRPIHRPNLLFGLKGRDQYLSIPYDANIGFMVYRKDIIEKFNAALKNKDIRMAYETAIFNEITAQGELFDDGYCFNGNTATLKSNISQLVTKSKGKFETWEEILAFFEIFPQIDAKGKLILKKNVAEYTHNNTGKSIGVLNGKPLHLLMETQTFDTFVSTMLEIIWNCGGSFEVSPDYKINNEQEAKPSRQMMRAMYLISKLFGLGIVPKNATLDADEFGKQYSKEYIKEPGGEWVFARHWYSTFIDVLTASNKVKVINKKGETTEKVRFSWDNEDARLDIMRMPVSYAHYVAENAKPDHISCWGDWHFCVLSGSENTRLGVDLINNLMSSEKVYQRAAANAALPSVEAFYKLYGDTNCFNVPQRADNLLPDMSYAEIRRQFFGTAQSRSQIFDFHHCMRELHSVLEYIRLESQKIITAKNFKGYNDYLYDGTESIYSRVQKTFANIEKFIELPLLME